MLLTNTRVLGGLDWRDDAAVRFDLAFCLSQAVARAVASSSRLMRLTGLLTVCVVAAGTDIDLPIPKKLY
jgi:hypothetical protein